MVTNNAWNSQNPAQVALGGTGSASFTAYGPVVAASTTTGALTSVSPSATSGVPLISQGASANPAFGTAVVAGGGTGVTSATAYAVLCGGTTTTNPFQSIASVGTSGQVLTSNGAGALPTFQSNAGGSIVKLLTQTAASSSTITFNSTYITATYDAYMLVINNVIPSASTNSFLMQLSVDNGSNYLATGYNGECSVIQGTGAGVSSTNITTAFPFTITSHFGTTNAWNGTIHLYNMTTGHTPSIGGSLTYFDTTAASQVAGLLGGWGPASITVNNIKFSLASGNFTTGTFTLYGVAQ